MKRKLIRRYGLLCLPFVCGSILYGMGSYNIVSSLLFFVGGYVALKNLCDCRKIKKNMKKIINNDTSMIELVGNDTERVKSYEKNICSEIDINKNDDVLMEETDDKMDKYNKENRDKRNDINNKNSKYKYEYKSYDSIPFIKRTRRYRRVRKRF